MIKLSYAFCTLFLLFLSLTAYSASPVITISDNSDIKTSIYSTYLDQGSTAIDAEDGIITSSILVSGNLDTSKMGNYYLQYIVTDLSGNSPNEYTLYTEIMQTLNISELARDQRFIVYPNLSSGSVSIQSVHHKLIISISLVNSLGHQVYNEHFNSKEEQLALSYLPSRMYLLEIASGGLLTQKRLIIN